MRRACSSWAVWPFALLLAGAAAPGCTCSSGKTQTQVTAVVGDAGSDDEDRVRPNYDLTGPADPVATRLCTALYWLPGHRRAKCCPGRTDQRLQHRLAVHPDALGGAAPGCGDREARRGGFGASPP